jgi:hypothetical protein
VKAQLTTVVLLIVLSSCWGCVSSQPAKPEGKKDPQGDTRADFAGSATRNNALALLHELLNDEKNLSKILIIKKESKELNQLVKDISKAAGEGVDLMNSMERGNPALEKGQTGLPPGEAAARESISKATRNQLLGSSGADFELQLLLSQVQALRYGSHLARIVADNDQQPDQIRAYKKLSVQLKMLEEQVVALIRKAP